MEKLIDICLIRRIIYVFGKLLHWLSQLGRESNTETKIGYCNIFDCTYITIRAFTYMAVIPIFCTVSLYVAFVPNHERGVQGENCRDADINNGLKYEDT